MSNLESEARGVELANQDKFAEARRLLQNVLETKAVPLNRAQVARNIAFTH